MTEESSFSRAPIKGEGMTADPDEFVWGCDCEKCKTRYANWKKKFDEEQNKMRGNNG